MMMPESSLTQKLSKFLSNLKIHTRLSFLLSENNITRVTFPKYVSNLSILIRVSSEAEMSADENEDVTADSFEDSFIDDGTIPTANTQAESGKVDMMAIYRYA